MGLDQVMGVALSNRMHKMYWKYVLDIVSSAGASMGHGCGGRWGNNSPKDGKSLKNGGISGDCRRFQG